MKNKINLQHKDAKMSFLLQGTLQITQTLLMRAFSLQFARMIEITFSFTIMSHWVYNDAVSFSQFHLFNTETTTQARMDVCRMV